MTEEECHLWYDFLNTHPVRFRRQQIIGRYIADFYCAAAKLVIELDGIQHDLEEVEKKDNERTAFLEGYGLTVIRFGNFEIKQEFEVVCDTIDAVLREKLGYDPYPE